MVIVGNNWDSEQTTNLKTILNIWRITLKVMLRVRAFICMLPAYVNRQISAYCFMPVLLDGLKQEVAWNNSRPSRCLPCILLYFRENTRWEQIWEIKPNVLHAWKQTLRYLPTYPLYAEWHTRLPQGSAARKTLPAAAGVQRCNAHLTPPSSCFPLFLCSPPQCCLGWIPLRWDAERGRCCKKQS